MIELGDRLVEGGEERPAVTEHEALVRRRVVGWNTYGAPLVCDVCGYRWLKMTKKAGWEPCPNHKKTKTSLRLITRAELIARQEAARAQYQKASLSIPETMRTTVSLSE